MPNSLCHFEFMTADVERCRSFYSSVFGWNFDSSSMPGYTLIDTGHEPSGGILSAPQEKSGPRLNVYFKVADMDQVLSAVKQNGGRELVPKTPIPGVGHFALFADPEGTIVGIMQPG